MRLVFSPRAETDLADIEAYIGQDNPQRAVTFVEDLIAFCGSLTSMPDRHQVYSADFDPPIRRAVFGRYLVFYRVSPDEISIVHVRHGAREPIIFDPLDD